MLVVLLLMAAPGPFDAMFDPASNAEVRARKVVFDHAVKKRGVGAAIRSVRSIGGHRRRDRQGDPNRASTPTDNEASIQPNLPQFLSNFNSFRNEPTPQ